MNKHTPGPWEVDTIDNEGTYGDGPDCHSGYKSHAVYDDKGRVLFDSMNSDAAEVNVEYSDDGAYVWDAISEANLRLAAAAPELVSALRLVATRTVLTSGVRAVVDAALAKAGYPHVEPQAPRFADTGCSQCGKSLGPGDAGVSRCSEHAAPVRHVRICGEGV